MNVTVFFSECGGGNLELQGGGGGHQGRRAVITCAPKVFPLHKAAPAARCVLYAATHR